MDKKMESWFFMRPGFSKFKLEPDEHRQYLFGKKDRDIRNYLLEEIEGASYSKDGYKAVMFGDYGRGKTHICFNLIHEAAKKNLAVVASYVKCPEFSSKEPFESFFRGFITSHRSEELKRIAEEYTRMSQRGEAKPIYDVVQSEDIALVMSKGLAAVDIDAVRKSARWLSGETKVDKRLVSSSIQPHLSDSKDFGAVLKGLTHMFATVDKKVPLYLIDEAERLQQVNHPDTYFRWLAAMREITEIPGVGIIFFIGGNTKNDIPILLLQPEIQRRILVANYVEFLSPGREEIGTFVAELLATVVHKGAVPKSQLDAVLPSARDTTIPADLQTITNGDADRLAAYPFEPDALQEFIDSVASGHGTNKPSEILGRLQRASLRAMRLDKRTIDSAMVLATQEGGV
jgi:hypothetical protein